MKLHRDLGVMQKTAWYLLHRIRAAMAGHGGLCAGPVEVDETFVGGREKSRHASKRKRAGRGTVGKVAVAGAKNRATGKVTAKVVADTGRAALPPFVVEHTAPGATAYTDEHGAYRGLPRVCHETVRHSVGESMSVTKPTRTASKASGSR